MSKELGLWDRVRMAPELAMQFSPRSNRRREKGTICGESKDKKCWRVDWDRMGRLENIKKTLLTALE